MDGFFGDKRKPTSLEEVEEVVVLEVSRYIFFFGGLEIFLGTSVLKHTQIYTVYIFLYIHNIYILGDGFKYFSFYPKKSHFD